MNITPTDNAGKPTPPGMYALCQGLIGTEAAIAFCAFVKEYERVLTAEDVLSGKVKKLKLSEYPMSTLNGLIEKVGSHCKDNKWSAKQTKNVADFAQSLPGEMMVQVWNQVTGSQTIVNIQRMHKLIGQHVVQAVQKSRNLS